MFFPENENLPPTRSRKEAAAGACSWMQEPTALCMSGAFQPLFAVICFLREGYTWRTVTVPRDLEAQSYCENNSCSVCSDTRRFL